MRDRTETRPYASAARGLRRCAAGRAACARLRREVRGRGDASPTPFDLALDFYVNADHAGIYTALENGYFADAGLDVKPRVPSDPSAPIKQVAAGRADLAISYEPEVMLARDQGLDVVAVGGADPAAADLADLAARAGIEQAGRSRGQARRHRRDPVPDGLPRHDPPRQRRQPRPTSSRPTSASTCCSPCSAAAPTRCSAASSTSRACSCRADGKHPIVQPVDELGIPTYDELVLVANGDASPEDPEAIRLFIAALERGTADAEAEPAGRDRRAARGLARARPRS